MKKNFFLLLLAVSLWACKKEKDTLEPATEQQYNDVSYGSDSRQKFDAFLPAGRDENTPLVVLVHGGTWISGDKADMQFIQNTLKQQGIASVNMNYRYASASNHYEGLMQDVGAVFAAITNTADKWRVRKNGYILLGVSAGAHMALLYSYAYQSQGQVKGVVSLAGPSVFSSEFLTAASNPALSSGIVAMVGADIHSGELSPRFAEASPLNRMSSVPTLQVHGTADVVVPFLQAQLLANALNGKGVANKLIAVEGGGHDLSLAGVTNVGNILSEISSFITARSK